MRSRPSFLFGGHGAIVSGNPTLGASLGSHSDCLLDTPSARCAQRLLNFRLYPYRLLIHNHRLGTHMHRMRFKFEDMSDRLGDAVLRPVIKIRIENMPSGFNHTFLVDTGSPDTQMAWTEAEKAGIDPSEGELVQQPEGFNVGGEAAAEVRGFTFNFIIEDNRYFIRLPSIPVLVIRPWVHPGVTAILGTSALISVRIEISAKESWLEVTPESEIPQLRR